MLRFDKFKDALAEGVVSIAKTYADKLMASVTKGLIHAAPYHQRKYKRHAKMRSKAGR